MSKLPDVTKAVSPFSSSGSAAVSKDGTIAYASVAWNVNPDTLDTAYLDKLNNAVAPATKAGLQVEYGAGAGEIGQHPDDLKSEIIGLSCALVLLLLMFGSLITAAIPLLSAIFSVVAGLSLLGLLAAAVTFPTTAPTIATLLGLGVAVDYGLFLVARHREQVDSGMDVVTSAKLAEGTSGAAIVVAGCTVVISILGLYISGVSFVGSLGLAAAIVVVVTMLAALTLVPTVVVKLPKQSSSDNNSLLSTMQSDISKTSGVASVTPAAVNSDGTTAVFNVIPTTRPQATAAATLDGIGRVPRDAAAAARGSLAVAQAKAFGSDMAAEVASDLFSLSGASAADERYDLSRHWRNARTHGSHDPVAWKYHHVGNYLLNGALPPNHGQI